MKALSLGSSQPRRRDRFSAPAKIFATGLLIEAVSLIAVLAVLFFLVWLFDPGPGGVKLLAELTMVYLDPVIAFFLASLCSYYALKSLPQLRWIDLGLLIAVIVAFELLFGDQVRDAVLMPTISRVIGVCIGAAIVYFRFRRPLPTAPEGTG